MIDDIVRLLTEQFLLFVFVLTRVAGLFMTMPVFGAQNIPYTVRSLIAVTVALVIAPSFWGSELPEPGNLLGLGVILGRETLIGLVIGLSMNILFSGLQLTGQIVSQMSGMSLADVFDPTTDTNVPVFAQMLDVTALAVFVTIGGHREMIAALLDSFTEMPPGRGALAPTVIDALIVILQTAFVTGIRASAPVLVSLLLAVLIVGLISRTLPQLNTMSLGFSFNAVILLGALAMTVGSTVWLFQEETAGALTEIHSVLIPSEDYLEQTKNHIRDLASD